MNNITRLWLCVCMSVFLFACSQDDDAPKGFDIKVNESDLTFLDNGGTGKLSVVADEEWSVETDAEWCRVSPANGRGDKVCEIVVDSSYLYQERQATLTFQMGTSSRQVVISQFGYQKVIELDSTAFEVPDYSDYKTMFREMRVRANVPYEVIIPQEDSWLSVERESVKLEAIPRSSKIHFDFQIYNDYKADRSTEVIFRQTNAKEGETPVEARLHFVQKAAQKITPSRAGDSLAILAIARTINCFSTFDSSQPMIYWNNVDLDEIEYVNEAGKTVTEMRVVGVNFYLFNTYQSIPYQIRYLDQLRTLVFTGNENSFKRYIELGDDVTYLPHLKSLGMIGYGVTNLPARLGEVKTLRELDFSGNHLLTIPEELIKKLDENGLEYLNISNNGYKTIDNAPANHQAVSDSLGMTGTIPEFFFHLKNVRYLYLSYNNFIGSIPDVEPNPGETCVLPKIRALAMNLNYLTGNIPEWLLNHPNLTCWDPYTLIFNQRENGRDSNGARVGFKNEPDVIEGSCPLIDSDGNWVEDVNKSALTNASFRPDYHWQSYFDRKNSTSYPKLSLKGHWSGLD